MRSLLISNRSRPNQPSIYELSLLDNDSSALIASSSSHRSTSSSSQSGEPGEKTGSSKQGAGLQAITYLQVLLHLYYIYLFLKATISLSLSSLSAVSPRAVELLQVFSFFHSDLLPEGLLDAFLGDKVSMIDM